LFPHSGGSGLGARLKRAIWWGSAIRLAQRLSGGASGALAQTQLVENDGAIELRFSRGAEALAGEQVAKRLRQLATTVGLEWRMITEA
jgi:exopolyphosphatase/guanosine-5'-triphosphate,3'-diphosphate pyrophosphatase